MSKMWIYVNRNGTKHFIAELLSECCKNVSTEIVLLQTINETLPPSVIRSKEARVLILQPDDSGSKVNLLNSISKHSSSNKQTSKEESIQRKSQNYRLIKFYSSYFDVFWRYVTCVLNVL